VVAYRDRAGRWGIMAQVSLPRRRPAPAPAAGTGGAGSPVQGRTSVPAASRRPAGAARLRAQANQADDAGWLRATQARHRRNIGFRIAILGLIVMFVFVLDFPAVRLYLAGQQDLRGLRAEAAQSREDTEDLKAELARWSDPAFVRAQARERLSYMMPGDIAFKVVDPENAPTRAPSADPTTDAAAIDIRPSGDSGAAEIPWYTALWESVVIAGVGDPEPSATDPE
jgi:cell division protein FtsB